MKKYEIVKVNPTCIARLHVGNYLIEAKDIINAQLRDVTKDEWSISKYSVRYVCFAQVVPSHFIVAYDEDGVISVYEEPISKYCIKEID